MLRIGPRTSALIFVSGLALTGCSREGAPPDRGPDGVASDSANFVNRVWQVDSSSSIAPGAPYLFLSDGMLLITSAHGTPLLGTWKYEGGALTMTEEGVPYRTDILKLSGHEFRIRSNNPGEPLEIRLVPAKPGPLPK